MEYYNLDEAKPLIIRRFKSNTNASISAMFRTLINHPKFKVFGDYPIISLIVGEMKTLRIPVDKDKLIYALRQSEELKGKSGVVEDLLK